MASCAERVMRLNGCWDKVRLIRKRSTAVTVGGPDADMSERANVLVTEVFDTELIGEGAISTFNHAHKHLLTVSTSLPTFLDSFYRKNRTCIPLLQM